MLRHIVLLSELIVSSVTAPAALPAVHINEAAMRAVYTAEGVSVAVPITSSSADTAEIKVEFLETENEVIASGSSKATLQPGNNRATVLVQLPDKKNPKDVYRLHWLRVRYTVSTDDDLPVTGIVALAAITPELFELRTAHPYVA